MLPANGDFETSICVVLSYTQKPTDAPFACGPYGNFDIRSHGQYRFFQGSPKSFKKSDFHGGIPLGRRWNWNTDTEPRVRAGISAIIMYCHRLRTAIGTRFAFHMISTEQIY